MTNSTSDRDERRLETRLHHPAKVWLETVSPVPGESEDVQILECVAVDFSANGIQVETSEALFAGSILPLYLEAERHPDPEGAGSEGDIARYCLSAEVRWVRPAATEGRYQIGFHLYESDQTSILEWKQFVVGQLG